MSAETINIKDVSFCAACDHTTQKYVLLFPATCAAAASGDALIALHGHGADRWQFIRDERDECRAARDFATQHQMLYVSPDYRATTSWMGPKAEADVVQIIGELRCNHRISRIFLCGGSMGGSAALTFAALHPNLIQGVASMNGTANFLEFENFQNAISVSFGGSKKEIPYEYKVRSAEFWPEKFNMPVGLAVSGRDTAVPPHSVLRLANLLEMLGKKVLLIHRAALGHVTAYADAGAILDYVWRNAGGAATGVAPEAAR